MTTWKIRDGGVTSTVTFDADGFAQRALAAAGGESARLLQIAAEEVATEARRVWYTEWVDEETGLSGDIQTRTLIDLQRGVVSVSVGSTDTRMAGNKPRVVWIHAPYGDSTTEKIVAVDHKTYWETPAVKRREYPMIARRVLNTKGRGKGGRYLIAELIRKPFAKKVKERNALFATAIVAKMQGGTHGR